MDPITLFILGTIAVNGIAGIFGRAQERKENREKAQHEKEQLSLQTETNLGMLDLDLAAQKDSDMNQATAIERGALGEITAGMQQSYIEQLAAESGHMDLLSSNAQERGTLGAQEGMSGARSDLTLGSIVYSDQARRVNASRSGIDRQRDTSIGIGQMNWAESKTRAQSLRDRYTEGSAVMDLYNFKKGQIEKGETLERDWLDKTIEDNKYNFNWFMADVFGIANTAGEMATTAYSGI